MKATRSSQAMAGTRAGIGGMIAGAGAYGWALLPTLYGTAMPGGIVAEEAYQPMLRGLLDRLGRACRSTACCWRCTARW